MNFRRLNMAKASTSWFSSIDMNSDGFITPFEFDGSSQLTEEVINWVEMKRGERE